MRALKRVLGVDLGTSSVKIVELAVEGGSIRVLRVAMAETGVEPAMSPDDKKALISKTARELVKKSKFGTKHAIFGISGLKVFIRRFRLPMTSEERLERIVQFEARQQIPFPLDKTDLQYQFFPVAETGEVDVILVAVRSDEIRDYMGIVDKVGLSPISMGVSSFALHNAHSVLRMNQEQIASKFASPKKGKAKQDASAEEKPADEESFAYEEVKAYVNIGAASYDIAIARQGKASLLGFTRTPPIGGFDFTKAVMEHCSVESFIDAEGIKRSAARLMAFDFGFEENDAVNEQACIAVSDAAERIVGELRRSLDFYISQPDGMAVDSVEISGGQALIPGIESFIEEKLTVPCSIVKMPPESSSVAWQDSFGPMTPFMIAMGLGFQGLGLSTVTVDFLPREKKIIRDFPYRGVAVMGALVIATIGISTRTGEARAAAYLARAQSVQSEMLSKSREIKEYTEAKKLNTDEAAKFQQFGKVFGQRDYWVKFLATVAELKPVDMLVDGIDMTHDGTVRIVGVSEREGSATDFVKALEEAFPKAAKKAEITALNDIKDPRYQGVTVFRFTIGMNPGDKINHLQVTPTPGANAGGNVNPRGVTPAPGTRVRGTRGR